MPSTRSPARGREPGPRPGLRRPGTESSRATALCPSCDHRLHRSQGRPRGRRQGRARCACPCRRCRSPTRSRAGRRACTRSIATGARTSCSPTSSRDAPARAGRHVRRVPRLRRVAQRLPRDDLHVQRHGVRPDVVHAARRRHRGAARAPARREVRLSAAGRRPTATSSSCAAAAGCASRDLSAALVRGLLRFKLPILTGLSSTYLYRARREYGPNDTPDDVRGMPTGHFVVIAGYDAVRRRVLVVDPYQPNPLRAVARVLDQHRPRRRRDPARHRHARRESARRLSAAPAAARGRMNVLHRRQPEARLAARHPRHHGRRGARLPDRGRVRGRRAARASSTCAATIATRAAATTCRCSPRRAATSRCPTVKTIEDVQRPGRTARRRRPVSLAARGRRRPDRARRVVRPRPARAATTRRPASSSRGCARRCCARRSRRSRRRLAARSPSRSSRPRDIAVERRDALERAAAEHLAPRAGRGRADRGRRSPSCTTPMRPILRRTPARSPAWSRWPRTMGMRAEIIGRDDIDRLADFDALFIRDTTPRQSLHVPVRAAGDGGGAGRHRRSRLDPQVHQQGVPDRAASRATRCRRRRTLVVHRDNVDRDRGDARLPVRPQGAGQRVLARRDEGRRCAARWRPVLETYFARSELVVAQEWMPTTFDWRVGVLERPAALRVQVPDGAGPLAGGQARGGSQARRRDRRAAGRRGARGRRAHRACAPRR